MEGKFWDGKKVYRKGMWRIVRAAQNSVYTILYDTVVVILLKARYRPLLHLLSLAGEKEKYEELIHAPLVLEPVDYIYGEPKKC